MQSRGRWPRRRLPRQPPRRPTARRARFRHPSWLPADRDGALKLHARGEEQLGRGNIYAARQFFERAAEVGLAESALALAATYDAAELARLKVMGLKPEPGEARKWYEKARELGAPEAEARLRRLGGDALIGVFRAFGKRGGGTGHGQRRPSHTH